MELILCRLEKQETMDVSDFNVIISSLSPTFICFQFAQRRLVLLCACFASLDMRFSPRSALQCHAFISQRYM